MAKEINENTALTNETLSEVVAQNSPKFAQAVGYSAESGDPINMTKVQSVVVADAEQANEYFSTLFNVVGTQIVYDLLRGKTSFYDVFEKPAILYGADISMIVPLPPEVKNYGTYTNPFDPNIPKTTFKNGVLSTNVKWQVPLRYSLEIMRGAFLQEYGVRDVLGVMVKNVYDIINLKKYSTFTADLVTSTTKTETAPSGITTLGDTEGARKLYEMLIKLMKDMSLPNSKYNAEGVETMTPKGRYVLIMNTACSASIDVNVLASLFNANAIKVRDTIEVDFGTGNESVMCLLVDDEYYVNIPRFEVTLSNINSATAEYIQFLHYWTRHGVIPWRQAVKILAPSTNS